ncbi:MAG: hypothetical protein WC718_16885 [Phycisphaerales bacterium]|jgi:hypothetical protein
MVITANTPFRANVMHLPNDRYGVVIQAQRMVALELTFDEALALRDEINAALGLTFANYAEFSGR